MSWVRWHTCVHVIHMHNTWSTYSAYRLFHFFFFFPQLIWEVWRRVLLGFLSSLDIVVGGTLVIPLGICFKAPREEPGGSGVSPEAGWGPGWCGVQLARVKCSCLAAGVGSSEEWQLCGFNLYAPSPGWCCHPIFWASGSRDWFIYYDYILKYRVLLSQPSGRMLENGFFPFQQTHCLS